MDIKLRNPASLLVYRCQPIGRQLKRKEKNFELLRQVTEYLYSTRDTIDEEVTKGLMRGKAPTLKCKKWLEKVGEIEGEVNEMLIQENSSDHLMHSSMEIHRRLKTMLNKITDHLEESPSGQGSLAYIPLVKSTTITSPVHHGEPSPSALVDENKNVYLQGRTATQGKESVPGTGQSKYLKTKATPSRAASIFDRKSLLGFIFGGATTEMHEVQTENIPSQNKRRQVKDISTQDFKKSSEPTITAARMLDVHSEMVLDRVIEMESVSREEAWELFCEQVGAGIVNSPGVKPFAGAIVELCGSLPLLIIITGKCLKGVDDVSVWQCTLRELLLPSTLDKHGVEAVMQRLKFSTYDRLKPCDVKSCFLYSALLSGDQEVKVYDLVKCFVQEGLISGRWDEACKRGYEIVDILVAASMLQSTKDGLKMQNVVRDLASMILLSKEERLQFLLRPYSLYRPLEIPESKRLLIHESCQFLLKGGAGLRDPPPTEKWGQAKIIALMDNELFSLPENPCCPDLIMLFLQRNRCLRVIPESFFDQMPSLQMLNLSDTRIKLLPQSISSLEGLKVLILQNCERLVVLPPEVGSLGDLEVLDLRGTELDGLPDEIGSLASLRHLEVSFYGSISTNEYAKLPHELISPGIISKLLSLEALSIDVYPGDQRWKKSAESLMKEVCSLTKLTALSFSFPTVELLELFLETSPSWKDKLLTRFNFAVGYDVKRIVSRVPNFVVLDYNQHDQCLRFVNGKGVPGVVAQVLARTAAFYLDHHLSIRSLSEFGTRELKFCIVSQCPQIQTTVDGTAHTGPAFKSLEHLSLHYLPNLKHIWKGPLPSGSFSKLRTLLVYACPKLKYVFTTTMLSCICNLEELVVEDCPDIEEITHQEEVLDSGIVLLLRLKRLTLNHLPRLVNISEGAWPSLEYISLYSCPNWQTIAMNSKVRVYCKED